MARKNKGGPTPVGPARITVSNGDMADFSVRDEARQRITTSVSATLYRREGKVKGVSRPNKSRPPSEVG